MPPKMWQSWCGTCLFSSKGMYNQWPPTATPNAFIQIRLLVLWASRHLSHYKRPNSIWCVIHESSTWWAPQDWSRMQEGPTCLALWCPHRVSSADRFLAKSGFLFEIGRHKSCHLSAASPPVAATAAFRKKSRKKSIKQWAEQMMITLWGHYTEVYNASSGFLCQERWKWALDVTGPSQTQNCSHHTIVDNATEKQHVWQTQNCTFKTLGFHDLCFLYLWVCIELYSVMFVQFPASV